MNSEQFLRKLLPGSTACSWAAVVVLAAALHARANGATADQAMVSIRPEAIRADMRFLADDALEGRGIETRGYAVAAKFMASEFEGLGLEPAGQSGYFQNVPLRSMRPDESKTSLTWVRAGTPETLIFRQDYISGGDPIHVESSVGAAVGFVGYGVTAKDQGYDDYDGIDAKGKIVAMLFGAPKFESSLKAHNSSSAIKRKNAAAHGAVGVINLDDPNLEHLYSFTNR